MLEKKKQKAEHHKPKAMQTDKYLKIRNEKYGIHVRIWK